MDRHPTFQLGGGHFTTELFPPLVAGMAVECGNRATLPNEENLQLLFLNAT